MITQVVGCNESVEVFRRVDRVSILINMVIGGSKRTRENNLAVLLNLIKSDRDKTVGDIKEVDRAKATIRALVSNDDNRVSMREKSKMEALLKVLESR